MCTLLLFLTASLKHTHIWFEFYSEKSVVRSDRVGSVLRRARGNRNVGNSKRAKVQYK